MPPMRWTPAILALCAACATNSGQGGATLQSDGAWVREFHTDRDTAYHATLEAFRNEGYSIERVNPLGGTIAAKSPVRSTSYPLYGEVLRYRMARADFEEIPGKGTRIRLVLTDTRENSGRGRDPTNDRPVGDREVFEEWFEEIAEVLEKG
jgi:hypothetical protein